MTMFSVNYTISFGINVSQKEIDEKREYLKKSDEPDLLWDLEITSESSDEEIARFIGVENWRSAEGTEIEHEDIVEYTKEQEERLESEKE